MISIRDDLLPGENDLDQDGPLDLSKTFVISRSWSSAFRTYVGKQVTDLKKDTEKKSDNKPCVWGLESLDLSNLGEGPTKKITCDYGNCSVMYNKQSIRLI